MKTPPALCDRGTPLCSRQTNPGPSRLFPIGKIRILGKAATRMNISRASFVHISNQAKQATIR